jgi:transposase
MELWPRAQPILPENPSRPQGGGSQRADERAMFAAVTFVLVTDLPWRSLPKVFDVSWQNAHRRFLQWSRADMWHRLTKATDDAPDSAVAGWAATLERAAQVRLREQPAAGVVTVHAVAAPRTTLPAWRKPVVRRVQRGLVEQLFGRSHTVSDAVEQPAPPSARGVAARSVDTDARPRRPSTDVAFP